MPLNGVQVIVPLNLYKDITSFAEFNGTEFDKVFNECLRTGFNVVRFGTNPLVEIRKQKERLSGMDVNGESPSITSDDSIGDNSSVVSDREPAGETDNNHTTINEPEALDVSGSDTVNLNDAGGNKIQADVELTDIKNINTVTESPHAGDDTAKVVPNEPNGDLKPVRKVVRRKRTLKEVKTEQPNNNE